MSDGMGLARRPRSWQLWLGSVCLGLMLVTSAIPAFSGSAQTWAQEDEEEPPPAGHAPYEEKPEKSFLEWLYDATGLFGSLIGIELLLLLFFAIEQGMALRRGNFAPPRIVAVLEKKLADGDGELSDLLKNDISLLARELAAGLSQLSHGIQAALGVMRTAGQVYVLPLDRGLSFILLIGITAPLLGVLGTIGGLTGDFSVVYPQRVFPTLFELAGPLKITLVSFFEGVVVGFPAIVAYVLLKQRQRRLVLETEWQAERLLLRLAVLPKGH